MKREAVICGRAPLSGKRSAAESLPLQVYADARSQPVFDWQQLSGNAVEWKIELALNSIFDVVILIVSYSMLFVLLQSPAIVVISENCVGIRSQTGPNHAIFWAGNSSEAFSP
ncbi:MAG TPA: hypothetical protein VGF29_03450 [Hyphomicrobiaceae bacterium]